MGQMKKKKNRKKKIREKAVEETQPKTDGKVWRKTMIREGKSEREQRIGCLQTER
jgi:hypothetical protein